MMTEHHTSPTTPSETHTTVLDIQDLEVRFGETLILHELHWSLDSHQIHALMGPGGVGKSTLLRVICEPEILEHFSIKGHVHYHGQKTPALVQQRLALSLQTVHEHLASNLPDRHLLTRPQQRELFVERLRQLELHQLTESLDQDILRLPVLQRRALAILRATLQQPNMICIDEPTAELSDEDAQTLLNLLHSLRQHHTIVIVSHHLARARTIADTISLMAGGQILESAPVEQFFQNPQHPASRIYLRTGACSVPSPKQRLEHNQRVTQLSDVDTEPEIEPAHALYENPIPDAEAADPHYTAPRTKVLANPLLPREGFIPASRGPNNTHWVINGRLGGTPLPGLLHPLDEDLDALQRLHTDQLITLTETTLPQQERCADFDINVIFFPIDDMHAPTIPRAANLCTRIKTLLLEDQTVFFHCKAGIGRTGTMLASTLIWFGYPATEALDYIRSIYRAYVQHPRQEAFLQAFDDATKHHPARQDYLSLL